jgi:ABC-type multidrug transport system ATPase subunit
LWDDPALRLLRPSAVSVRDLSRGHQLDHVSLLVPVGARLLITSEPEGAGSVLLRVLAGLSRPDSGRIEIAGLTDPTRAGWGRRVAYLGPEPAIHPWMSPREALALASDLLGLEGEEASRRMERALAWAGIPRPAASVPVGRESPQLAQRTALATVMLGDPEVLLLDEPLRGIDADERRRLLNPPGARRTVLLASRYPSAEAGLVGHIALLRHGRVELIARISDLEAAGLPLSIRGLVSLAEQRARAEPVPA